jgi:hypothetical protein
MELYIRIVDGQPFEHPIMGDNFREAFPDVDVESLPPEFSRFERVDKPTLGVYEVYVGVTYEFHDNVWKDVHHVRAMTAEEKAEQIAVVLAKPHPDGWVFDEERCAWVPDRPSTKLSGAAPNVIG